MRAGSWIAFVVLSSSILLTGGCRADGSTSIPAATGKGVTQGESQDGAGDDPKKLDGFGEPLPVPPGARKWSVETIDDCSVLDTVDASRLVVRVPVATMECVNFSPHNEFLVVVAPTVARGLEGGRAVYVPGFNGMVRAVLEHMNRGALRVVKPADSRANYLIVWDGQSPETVDELIEDLFVDGAAD